MIIDIKYKVEDIKNGDLVHSKILGTQGFIGVIENKHYFINNQFENWSDGYEDISELIRRLELELVAKNKNILVTLKKY